MLRFLGAAGQCPAGVQHAIPGFASWQLATVPRFLVADDVERLIASCPADAAGLRDKAVLLLLGRLGLRASEVAGLRFADVDWTQGLLTVSGKSRRQERLPLPQEVGDALLCYLRRSRPPLRTPGVFISVVTPLRPLTRAGVTHIVRAALRRAGSKAPINGAHVLRHSAITAITAMLTTHVDPYLSLRQGLGFKLSNAVRHLHAFAGFASARGDTHIVASTAVDWATAALSPNARHNRLRDVVHLARFLHAEDRAHEVPPPALFPAPQVRPLPYIYTLGKLAQIIEAAGRLRQTYPLRHEVYATLLGLIAATAARPRLTASAPKS